MTAIENRGLASDLKNEFLELKEAKEEHEESLNEGKSRQTKKAGDGGPELSEDDLVRLNKSMTEGKTRPMDVSELIAPE